MDARTDGRLRVPQRDGAWLWVWCFQFFVMEQVVRWGWRAPYSFRRNYVSDLGAQFCVPGLCSPWHGWMNASFVLEGALIALGAMRLWGRLAEGRVGKLAMVLLVLCGAGLVAVGFVPEDVDVPIHARAAVLYFLGGGFGVLLVGVALVRLQRWKAGWGSVVLGVVVVAATVMVGQMSKAVDRGNVGAVERVAVYGLTGWFVAMGAWVLRRDGVGAVV